MNNILQILIFLLLATSAAAQCPPVLLNCSSGPQEICDETVNDPQFWNESYWWSALYSSHDLAEGTANLQFSAIDTCQSGNLSIRYRLRLDLDADGTKETVIDSDQLPGWNTVYFDNANADSLTGGTARKFDERPVPDNQKYGFALQTVASGDTLTAYVRWNTPWNAQHAPDSYALPQLPHGATHEIEWIVTLGAEVNTCTATFKMEDCKKPTVVCINGLSVNIMPTKMITLWDTDFLQYTQDNITPTNFLKTAIRKSGTGVGFPTNPNGSPQKNVTFDCTELGTQLIELWSIDLTGKADYCETYVIVQNGNFVCGGPIGILAEACVKTACSDIPLEEVGITIGGGNPSLPPVFDPMPPTGPKGCMSLGTIPFGGSYSVTPVKDNDPLNGVSTFDLVLINKHILGVEALNSPYKLIAADANKSRSVTTFDIVELRKLILGIYTELPNNTSWRFVPKDFVFPNPNNPFQGLFPESMTIDLSTKFPIEFSGIKVGDVNCNAVTSSFSEPNQDRATAVLALPDAELAAGQILETPLYLPATSEWLGLQFELAYDREKIELEEVAPGELNGLDGDAFAQTQPGLLSLSWFDAQPQTLVAGTPLLQLRWRAKTDLRLSDVVRLQTERLRPEAYPAEEREQVLELLFGNPLDAQSAVVFAPQPNPTAGSAILPVQLAAAETVQLELFDLQGRLIFQNQLALPGGLNRLEIPASAMVRAGLYVWRLQAGDLVWTGKLVRI